MELFFQFASVYWYLFGALALLFALLMRYEGNKAGPALTTQQLTRMVNKEDAVVVDLRTPADYKSGHIVDAENISHEKIMRDIDHVSQYKDRPIIFVDKMGQHSSMVARKLRGEGQEQVFRLAGGMMEWTGSQLPVVKGDK